jgi:hypothetical protein
VESLVPAIVGRDGEQGQLSAFVTAAGGQALILRGETGVGKSGQPFRPRKVLRPQAGPATGPAQTGSHDRAAATATNPADHRK